MQRILIFVGLAVIVVGVLWPWLAKIPIGRLPGDIVVDRPRFKLFVPLTTMVIASVLLTALLRLLRR